MGNREWGIGEAVRPLPPHPDFMESAIGLPIPTIPHSRLPIPKGRAAGSGPFPIPHSQCSAPLPLPSHSLLLSLL